MTAGAKQLAGIALLSVAALGLWYLISSDWHESAASLG